MVSLIQLNEPIVITNTLTPIGLAQVAEDTSITNMSCVVSGFQKSSNEELSMFYWNVINVSKQGNDKAEWYLNDTICHEKTIWSFSNVSVHH